jgi:hypothetical protein
MGKERFPGMSEEREGDQGLARRFVHMCAPVFLVYYLVPNDCWIGVPKNIALLVILLVVLLSDFVRILLGLGFYGLRSYECARISAYSWASLAFAIAFIAFRFELVVPVIFGMAWIDPLCGYLRKKKKGYPLVPIIAYAILAFLILYFLSDFYILKVVILAVVGSTVAIASEYPNLKHMDDDFLMVIMPLLALAFIDLLI